jgi:hypothetical protein
MRKNFICDEKLGKMQSEIENDKNLFLKRQAAVL